MKILVSLGWMIGLIIWAVCMWAFRIYALVKGKDLAWKEQIRKKLKRFCIVFALIEAILILTTIFVPRIAKGDYLLEGMSNSSVVVSTPSNFKVSFYQAKRGYENRMHFDAEELDGIRAVCSAEEGQVFLRIEQENVETELEITNNDILLDMSDYKEGDIRFTLTNVDARKVKFKLVLNADAEPAGAESVDAEQADKLQPQTEEQLAVLENPEEETKEPSEEELLEQAVTDKLSQMTIEEKVAQMFMITPEALTDYTEGTQASDITYQALKEYPVGGIIFFAGNIVDKEQLIEMTGNMQEYSKEITGLPLLLGIDEEGGSVARIAQNSNFEIENLPDMWAIGQSADTAKAYEAGKQIGTYLKQYGFNLDFAPVADVWTNPQNEVIGKRAFSSDAKVVADMDEATVKGLNEAGIYACLKHFPGHGDTASDTHTGYAYTDKTLEELKENELIPFRRGIENGISFIMVSHIGVPKVTDDNIPASLSWVMIEEVLRKRMGFEGIVITDALNMGAITAEYDSAAACRSSLCGGRYDSDAGGF